MRVKHGARWRVTVKSGGRVLDKQEGIVGEDVIPSRDYFSLLFNRNISGGVDWWDPSTGYAIESPTYRLQVPLDPSDLLEGDALCDCPRCAASPESDEHARERITA